MPATPVLDGTRRDCGCRMMRRCDDRDFEAILTIISDGAEAYKGVIPANRWTEPYMSREHLRHEMQ